MSRQLITGAYVSVSGFGTLLKGTLVALWRYSGTSPYNKTPSMESSASQPSAQQTGTYVVYAKYKV